MSDSTTFTGLLRALEYVESRLPGPTPVEDVALVAGWSPSRFQHIFSALTGETPAAYVRARRLTIAARRLTETTLPLLDIAFDCGFGSQEAFTRAFKDRFRATPRRYRVRGANSLSFERGPFSPEELRHRIHEGVSREPRLIELPEVLLLGLETLTNFKDGALAELWERFMEVEQSFEARENLGLYYELGRVENPGGDITEDTLFRKFVGVEIGEKPGALAHGLTVHRLKKSRYAVFEHRGTVDRIQDTYDYIYGVWAMNNGVRLGRGDDIQLFDIRERPFDPREPKLSVCVPIESRSEV